MLIPTDWMPAATMAIVGCIAGRTRSRTPNRLASPDGVGKLFRAQVTNYLLAVNFIRSMHPSLF